MSAIFLGGKVDLIKMSTYSAARDRLKAQDLKFSLWGYFHSITARMMTEILEILAFLRYISHLES